MIEISDSAKKDEEVEITLSGVKSVLYEPVMFFIQKDASGIDMFPFPAVTIVRHYEGVGTDGKIIKFRLDDPQVLPKRRCVPEGYGVVLRCKDEEKLGGGFFIGDMEAYGKHYFILSYKIIS